MLLVWQKLQKYDKKSYNKIRSSRLSLYVNMGYDVLTHATPICQYIRCGSTQELGVELENAFVFLFS